MSKMKIYLIEDETTHASETIEKLRSAAKEYSSPYEFEFEWMKGTVKYQGEKYLFYEEEILEQIQENINKEIESDVSVGLLLDTILTQDDLEYAVASYYPRASLARDIYFKFYEKIPVYIVTATSAFGGQSDIIMGKDLSEQYINQRRLAMNPLKNIKDDTDRLFRFYVSFYEGQKQNGEVK